MARHRSGSMFRYFRIYRSLLLPRFYQEISSQKTRTAGHFQISRKFSAPQAPGQRQRKEKQRVSGTSNEVSAKPNPRGNVLQMPENGASRQKIPDSSRHIFGRPPYLSQLAHTCKFGAWRSFLLDRARPVFFSARSKRKWGVDSSDKVGTTQPADWLPLQGIEFNKNTVQCIESGNRFVTDLELKAIAQVLGVTADELLSE